MMPATMHTIMKYQMTEGLSSATAERLNFFFPFPSEFSGNVLIVVSPRGFSQTALAQASARLPSPHGRQVRARLSRSQPGYPGSKYSLLAAIRSWPPDRQSRHAAFRRARRALLLGS